jgi:pilus assembly protein CpaB
MNWSRLTSALLIALFVSGACTYLVSRRLSVPAAQAQAAERRYVATAKALQAGEVLRADSLELVSWPATKPIPGGFTTPQELVGRAMLYPIDKDQPLTDKLVTAAGAGVGLAGRIPEGMRAIALRSDEVMGVAGFLLPGSHVDVLVTYHTEKIPEAITATVLQNAEVLAAGHQVQPDPDGKPATVTVVTLLLTPEDAERAVLATTQGTVHFVLRSGSDTEKRAAAPMLMSQMLGEPAAAAAAVHTASTGQTRITTPRAAPRPVPTEFVVQTILGDKQTTDTFQRVARP